TPDAASYRLSVGLRVLAFADLHHDLGCQLPRIGKTDRIDTAEVKPTRTTVERVDTFPRLVSARLDLNTEAVLPEVPNQIRSPLSGLQVLERQIVQFDLVRLAARHG